MFGWRLKSWMESQMAKVRHPKSWTTNSNLSGSSGLPSSCSVDTSILLGGGSSIGSFTTAHNFSSPDTGYSTDGNSPRTNHPLSKTDLLTQVRDRDHHVQSPQKPPRLSLLRQQGTTHQLSDSTVTECNRHSFGSSSGDSGQGTLGSSGVTRISGDSGIFKFPNISEEHRETEILSDWTGTDDEGEEGYRSQSATQRNPLPPIETYIPTQTEPLPKPYETLQLLNQCNHVFPLPSCTGPRCLQARVHHQNSKLRKSRFSFLTKLFRRKSGTRIERDLPENSRGKPIRPGPTAYWLTPTPNSFRKRNTDSTLSGIGPGTVPKGLKSDIIRLPGSAPATLPPLPGPPCQQIPANLTPRPSPFLTRQCSNPASPVTITRLKPQQVVTPIHQSPRPVVAFVEPSLNDSGSSRLYSIGPNRIQIYNNYSPIHRLVVTNQHKPPPPQSPLVRTHHIPPPPPRSQNSQTVRSQLSSNQNSPVLNQFVRRINPAPFIAHSFHQSGGIVEPFQEHAGIYEPERIYERVEGTEISDDGDGEGGDYEWDVSLAESEVSVSQSTRSQSQESTQTYHVGLVEDSLTNQRKGSIVLQDDLSTYQRRGGNNGGWTENAGPTIPSMMTWGGQLTDTEVKLLEKEAELKYRQLLWEAEILLRQFTRISNDSTSKIPGKSNSNYPPPIPQRQFVPSYPIKTREERIKNIYEDCPQSDPLRRKTYDCWALRRLQQEMALSCVSPPVLHRSRQTLLHVPSSNTPTKLHHCHHQLI